MAEPIYYDFSFKLAVLALWFKSVHHRLKPEIRQKLSFNFLFGGCFHIATRAVSIFV